MRISLRTTTAAAFAIVSTLGALSPSHGATVHWLNNPVDDNWLNTQNWNGGALPTPADTARVAAGTINIRTVLPSIERLEFGSNSAAMTEIIIHEGGVLRVTGGGLTRFGDRNGGKNGTMTIDGGLLDAVGRVYLGVNLATVNAVLTVKNGGVVNGGSLGMGHTLQADQQATLNIGGATTAEAAGWLNLSTIEAEAGNGGTTSRNQNTINFNHTSQRYLFSRSATDTTAININGAVKLDLKAGVTVLTGTNRYTDGTTIRNGAILLANTTPSPGSNVSVSATGSGPVTVEAGGVLGGIGFVGGATRIEGTLKPGDYDYSAAIPTHGVLSFENDVTFTNESLTEIAIQGLVRGIDYDAIDIAGDATFDGTLKIVLQLGFTLAAGETAEFQLFNIAGNTSGNYTVFELPELWNGLDLQWDTSNLSNTGSLSVTAIPEPSSLVTLALGLGGLTLLQRRFARRAKHN